MRRSLGMSPLHAHTICSTVEELDTNSSKQNRELIHPKFKCAQRKTQVNLIGQESSNVRNESRGRRCAQMFLWIQNNTQVEDARSQCCKIEFFSEETHRPSISKPARGVPCPHTGQYVACPVIFLLFAMAHPSAVICQQKWIPKYCFLPYCHVLRK